ncbi:MAG TPA: hypothetical protein VIV88_06520 [Gemmatimonadales bacterium]|jgi:hypothetical protein
MFRFVGGNEADPLNVTLAHLALESGSKGRGTAVRVRNFSGLFVEHVDINHFNIGLWADWGIGVHLYGCNVVLNNRGLQVGGVGGPGGIRGGDRQADPFMDTVVVEACRFAQNGLDINDMGSNRALGGTVIRDSSFYEYYLNPVQNKLVYIRIANRKGIVLCGNWFEGGHASRTCVYFGDHDHDGNLTGPCHGGAVFANHFLQTGPNDTIGVEIARSEAVTIFANCFEFAPHNNPIRIADEVGRNTVGQNSYLIYPDRVGYVDPIGGSLSNNQILDPRLGARMGSDLQIGGRVASAIMALTYGPRIVTDAAAGNYFTIPVTDRNPFTILDPMKPVPGEQILYDIRNNSTGPMGTITWGGAFKLAGQFIGPSNNKRKTITFYYDGAAWIETARAGADI